MNCGIFLIGSWLDGGQKTQHPGAPQNAQVSKEHSQIAGGKEFYQIPIRPDKTMAKVVDGKRSAADQCQQREQ